MNTTWNGRQNGFWPGGHLDGIRAWRCTLALAAVGIMFSGSAATARSGDMGGGTLVGRVTNTTGNKLSRKIFVEVGRVKWALHVGHTDEIYHADRKVSVHDIDVGSWVKASGKRIGKLRLQVDRIDVIGDRLAYRKSKAFRRAQPDGYFIRR